MSVYDAPANGENVDLDLATWTTIGTAIVSGAAGVATFFNMLVTFQVRRLNAQQVEALDALKRDREVFDQDRKRLHDREMVRFSQLHQKRALVLAEVYSNLVAVVRDCKASMRIFAPDEDLDAARDRASISFEAFDEHFHRSRIYFPDDVAAMVESFSEELKLLVVRLPGKELKSTLTSVIASGQDAEAFRRSQAGQVDEFAKKVLPVEAKIRATFQELLGGA